MVVSAHTPGPWSAERHGEGDFRITYNDVGNWLAEVFNDADPVPGRTEADARLIAAAPDLLQALREAIDFHGDEDNEIITRWRAAVSKAEDRT